MLKPSMLILAALCSTPLCAATLPIYAAGNSKIEQGSPDTVWSDWGTLTIQNYVPGVETSDIFRFDLAGLPSGATVTAARLWLYDTGWDNAQNQLLYWHPDSSWSPSTITWNTFSTASNQYVGVRNGTYGWQYNAWNIDLGSWDWRADAAQGAASFQLRMAYGDGYFNQNDFISLGNAESQNHPYLELEYTGGDAQTPEPGAFLLLGGGLAMTAFLKRRAA